MIVVANLQGLTRPWLGEEASLEHSRPVAESPMPSSQTSHLYSAGSAGGSRGGSDRCSTPTMADIPGYGKVTLQGQPPPGAVSLMRSSQRNDTNSGRDGGGNSGHRGASELYSTPTRG